MSEGDHREGTDSLSGQSPGGLTLPLLASTIIAALGGLLFGFDTAVISGTTSALRDVFQLSSFGLGFTVASALIGTIVGSQRYSGQVENIEHVGIDHLVGERKADNIELAERPERFQSEYRDILAPENLFGITIRGKKAFAQEAVIGIDDIVQDLQTEVRHPDIVHVGISMGNREAIFGRFYNLAQFAAGVAPRLIDIREEFFF